MLNKSFQFQGCLVNSDGNINSIKWETLHFKLDTHGGLEKWIWDEKYICFVNQSNIVVAKFIKALADYNSVC